MFLRPVYLLIYIALCIVWGSSFILMKKAMLAFSSFDVAALRIVLASTFFLPFLFRHLDIKVIKQKWKPLLAMGVFGNLIPAFLFTEAETVISSSLAGMLNALTPIFTLLVGLLFFRSKTSLFQVLGLLLGFVGAMGLLYFTGEKVDGSFSHGMMIVLATICYAISLNAIGSGLKGVNPITASALAMTAIGPFAAAYLVFSGFFYQLDWSAAHVEAIGYTAILGVFGTSLAVIVFNSLIHYTSAVFASSLTYFIPVIALSWGIWDGEPISILSLCFLLVIMAGVYLSRKKGQKMAKKN